VQATKKGVHTKEVDRLNNAAKPVTDFFNRPGYTIPLLTVGVIALICCIVFRDYLFSDKTYIFKDVGNDTINLSYPYLRQTAIYMGRYGLPSWSFSFGAGQNLLPFFLDDPFDVISYIAGVDNMAAVMVYKEMSKIMLAGLLFFFYLKTLNLSGYTALTGSLFYAFTGFMIVGGGWYIFSSQAVTLVLLLLAFEQLFTKNKWLLFPLPVMLLCISQPFNLFPFGVFIAIYALLRHFQTGAFNFRNISSIFLKMLGLGLIGMLIAAPLMMEKILQILESPRGSGANAATAILSAQPVFELVGTDELGTSILRLFSTEMLGSGSGYKGWRNILEAPMFYCGLPCLFLMPQLFMFQKKREKIIFMSLLALWVLPVVFPYFRYAFWLFTGNYYRIYCLIVAFFFMYYSLLALEQMIVQKRKPNLILLLSTTAVLFLLLNSPFFADDEVMNHNIYIMVSCLLVVYVSVFFMLTMRDTSFYMKYVLLILIVCELAYFSGKAVNDRDAVVASDFNGNTGYNDHTKEALSYIKQIDPSFYRIDKTYSSAPGDQPSVNDAMVQDYRGTSIYTSFNQEYYIRYLKLMNLIDKTSEVNTRWVTGLTSNHFHETQNQVKYLLTKQGIPPDKQALSVPIAKAGDVTILKLKFTLPFGYSYGRYIRKSVFENLDFAQKELVTFRACVLEDEDVKKFPGLQEFPLKDTIDGLAFNTALYGQYISDLSKDALVVTKFEETVISGHANFSGDKMMYLSIPYDNGWHLKVDGQPKEKVILNAGMTGIMLTKGPHTIEMEYHLRVFGKGLLLSALGLLAYGGVLFYTTKSKRRYDASQISETGN
jgi:hypothetical protein